MDQEAISKENGKNLEGYGFEPVTTQKSWFQTYKALLKVSSWLSICMNLYLPMYIFKNSKNLFAFFILVISDKICDEISRTWSCDHVFCDTHFVHCVFVISYKVQDTLYLMTQHI